MVRSKIGTTDNIIATEPLVFSVLIWNYMHLGFKSCHGVTLKKKKSEMKLDLLLVPENSSPFPFPLLIQIAFESAAFILTLMSFKDPQS